MIEKEAKYELKLELKKYLNQKTNYSTNNLEFKLKLSSKDDLFVLICDLFKDTINDFIRVFNENDIHFDYVNENPEIHALSSDPKSSDFSDKFYFNVGIDDKFGFDPESDWVDLYDFLARNSH